MSYLQEDRLGHRSDSNSGCAIRADADFRVDDPVAVLLEFFSVRILLCYLGLTLSGRHSKVEPLSGGSRGSISAPHLLLRSWYQTACFSLNFDMNFMSREFAVLRNFERFLCGK